ncbi:MAG: imidazolonepropionase [Bacillota bacterium]
MIATLVVHNIKTLLTPSSNPLPLRGKDLDDMHVIHDAYIAVNAGTIIDVGCGDYEHITNDETITIDAQQKICTPGLIDAHTHVVHGGSREHEFEQKMRGVPYLEILEQGGGIHNTVEHTRAFSKEKLYKQAQKSLNHMLSFGVTTVEGKSGYGLDEVNELKQLRVQKHLHETHPIDIISTFMGAHALPKAYETNRQEFLDLIVGMLPKIKEENLADFVDVFCEDGAFTVKESEYILSKAKALGFKLKIHADEIKSLGGVQMAVDLGATSADHLMAINEKGMNALRNSNTIGTILPNTSFYLNSAYAPVRKMINHNIAIALSSDYNPGSSPSENFLFTLNLAAIHLKMSPYEILNAATINTAYALDIQDKVGKIEPNYKADFILFDAPNWPYVLYHYAINHVTDVFKDGVHVIKNRNKIWE